MKRAITTLTAALIASAAAQDIATSLPLTSVGNKLLWTVGDQDLKLVVGVASRVQLDLYSAQFDPKDYRSATYYGDESYADPSVHSTFSLIKLTKVAGQADQEDVLLTKDFGRGQQDWQTFINQDLPAGEYTLRVQTEGNGKNTFALRLKSISAAIQSDRLNVNIHSHEWVPALNVYNKGGPLDIRMYDGDGPSELQAELRDASGNAYPVKVSDQLEWEDIAIPEAAGNYTLYLKQPGQEKQFSNTVGFDLRRANEPAGPITVVQADTTGQLQVTAELILPYGNEPTQATVEAGDKTLAVNGEFSLRVPSGDYPVSVAPITGAEVSIDKSSVTVPKQGVGKVAVQVKPDVALSFSANKPEVCVGDVVTFTAQATTAFERQALNAAVQVSLPAGFTANGESSFSGKVDAKNPGVLTFEATATAATPEASTITASLTPWNKTQSASVRVLPTATQIELRRSDVAPVQLGEIATITLSLKNTSAAPAPYTLTDSSSELLEPLDPPTFSGTLAPGEEKTLSYRARVKAEGDAQAPLTAVLKSNCESTQQLGGVLVVKLPPPPPVVVTPPTPEAQVEPAPVAVPTPVAAAPSIMRESVVQIPFDAPRSANQIIIAHSAPQGSTYVMGSSALNSKPIVDPEVGKSGRFYWTTPGAPQGVLTYKVAHEGSLPALNSPALVGRYAHDRQEVLIGDVDLSDLSAAQSLDMQAQTENAGAIKLPLDGAIFRERDRITLAVSGSDSDNSLPTVNGVAVSEASIGKKVIDAANGVQRREFYGVMLRAGENTIAFGGQSIKVSLAGVPVKAEITARQLVADGINPIQVNVKLLDAQGVSTFTPVVTVESSLEPTVKDAQPAVASYQITLKDGEGVLELQPLSAPTRFNVKVQVGDKVFEQKFDAQPSQNRVGIGFLSATAGLDITGPDKSPYYGVRGAAYYETPLAGGKLYVAGAAAGEGGQGNGFSLDAKQGLAKTTNPLERYSTYGDSSTEDLALQGIDPVAFRYEHPNFNIQYRQSSLPISVFSINATPTALSGFTRTNPGVSGFAAYLSNDQVNEDLIANGTRVLNLSRTDVTHDSETVQLVSVSPLTQIETIKTLKRYVDYTLDSVAGVLYFSSPVNLVDETGSRQIVRVNYTLVNGNQNRSVAWGAQIQQDLGPVNLAAAVVNMNGVTTTGARVSFSSGNSSGSLLAAYSGGIHADGGVSGKTGSVQYGASFRYQDGKYVGLNSTPVGTAAVGQADVALTDKFGVRIGGDYSSSVSNAAGTASKTNTQGHVSLLATYLLNPVKVGLGVEYGFGDTSGLAGVASVGYVQGENSVDLQHSQPISGGLKPHTTLRGKVGIARNVTLNVSDDYEWGGDNAATVGLQTTLGGTNLSVSYDLPGNGGSGNRARFGVDTSLPLGEHLGLGVSGSYAYSVGTGKSEWNVGPSLKYTADNLVATTGVDLAQTDHLRTVVKGGVSYNVTDQFSLSLDGTKVFSGVKSEEGNQFAVSAALRNGAWQGLSYLRYSDGALGGKNPQFIGEANAEYHRADYSVRAGLAGRMLAGDSGSLTLQLSVSGTYYLNDTFGIGAAARGLFQPGTNYSAYSLGLEASARVLPGTWATLGYNPVGFDGVASNLYTRRGLYVRLDLMLDDGQRDNSLSLSQGDKK
ncbi:DUF11 domain-containing protein [Deinococcus detaillensis]|uniref:DUF11 domain-containing protein n=1 Tax=Deinococcus detaillensis TaxID=2592048 RepID=A0A553V2V5_9DEIO|nr:DUF11 domain-containing protein [Deinococcus detaillensis]TSA86786.1 DUF11 domain-containing protein [Deinococcus detaillensis]